MNGLVIHPDITERPPVEPTATRRYGPCRIVISLVDAPGTQYAEPVEMGVVIPPTGAHEVVMGHSVADALSKAKCRVHALYPDFTPPGTRLEAL